MGKQVAQGTAHETHLRKHAAALGRTARRTAKAGQANEADVIIEGTEIRPAVAWKHMRTTEGHKKRSSLRTVTILEEDWFRLMEMDTAHTLGWAIQAKATQRLNVSAILSGLMEWMKG